MDFYADILRIAKAELDLYEVGYTDLSDDRLIVERWINVYLKLIRPTPRHILHSAKVVAASHEPTLSPILAAIEAKFRRGEDINPHLTRL